MKNFPVLSPCLFVFSMVLMGCNSSLTEKALWQERHLTNDFKEYWFAGEAEITSYELVQSRYGEPREGTATLVYVTEDFIPKAQVKADSQNRNNIPVLKLNSTKEFVTGIYPYSIMQSTFYPLEGNSHALKITASIQEWCGQVFMQLNNRSNFEIQSFSYFEIEGDRDISLARSYLENEIWTQLRVDPEQLPVGEISMIPAMEYIRLAHIETEAYEAYAEFYQDEELAVYQIEYPALGRTLRILYEPYPPFRINKWEEITVSNNETFQTTATKMNVIKSAYWNKNSNNDLPLREKLNLP